MQPKKMGFRSEDARYSHLPVRIVTAIHDQQNMSERLVGWFQLAVVTLFGLLYTAAPKTFSTETTFELVPWVLSVYLFLTLMRLFIAYRSSMSDGMLYVSVVIDMGLLLAMIWTFHLQYQQPPTFYLKSPTLLYVFIFIALRALRFQARFVVTAGLVAAAGWIMLAVYAMNTAGGMKTVTRDYVYYMTSNSILIGAELDKVVTILTVTAILAVAITRARRLLVQAVTESAAVHDLSRFFSPEIAKKITAAEQAVKAGQGQVRNAAILMTDIRGFTRMAMIVEPDDLMNILADYQSKLVPVIQRHGGSIDKFMGDGILATFGAAVTTNTYAADALRAVDEIMAVTQVWQTECLAHEKPVPCVGAAVTTGRIIFGAVGDATRLEYTVIGDAVNLSAKLEKHTKKEGVRALCTVQAYQKAVLQGYQPPAKRTTLNDRQVEGVEKPLDIMVLGT
jgi:adenylate cyclase